MVTAALSRRVEEPDRDLTDRVSEAVPKTFSQVPSELGQLANPLRRWIGSGENAGLGCRGLAAGEEPRAPDTGEESWSGSEEGAISLHR